MQRLIHTVALALVLGGCHEDASPSPAASAPASSTSAGPGAGMGFGGMQGMGFGGMQGMGVGDGSGGGMGTGMGAGPGGPTKFPPWHLSPEAEEALAARQATLPPPNVPSSVSALEALPAAPPGRCSELRRTHLYVLRGDRLIRSQTIAEAMASPEAFELTRGRAPARRALPLLALVPADVHAGEVVIYPCLGDAVRITIGELRAAPNRYSLVQTPKGLLKLVDATAPPEARARALKNIAAVLVL